MKQIALLNKVLKPYRVPFSFLLNKERYKIVKKGAEGFTLVEVMIALVVSLLVFLALMQTALVGIDSNMKNVLRDEAVRIAEMKMNEERNKDFNKLRAGTFSESITRNIRNVQNFSFTVNRTITDLNTDNKQINITVIWEWKENTIANGNPYTHVINTILRKQ